MSTAARRFFVNDKPRGSKAGGRTGGAFTLMEVLLAIALFVIATGILSGSLYSGLQAYRAGRNDAQVENRYRLALREVLAISARDEFDRSGTVRLPDGGTASWEADLEQSDLVDLFTARVVIRLDANSGLTLSDGEARQGRTFELVLYRPSWSDVTERSSLLDDRRSALERRREGR